MRRFAALFIGVMTVGCLRPVWTELPIMSNPPAANGEPDEIIEAREFETTDGDTYTLTVDSVASHSLRVTFYAISEDPFFMPCEWQGRICRGLLPTEARAAHIVVLRDKTGVCPRFRIFREDEELEIADQFSLGGCGFLLESPP